MRKMTGGQQDSRQPVTLLFNTKKYFPVVHFSMVVRITKNLALQSQSFPLFSVDVSLHAGLSSGDQHGVPQRQGS